MPSVTSNDEVHLTNREASTVENKGFHMAPLLSSYYIGAIHTINLKIVYLDNFRPFYVESGERAQTALEGGVTAFSPLFLFFLF